MKRITSLTIQEELADTVKNYATGLGVSMSQFIEGAIKFYLKEGMQESVKKDLTKIGKARAKIHEAFTSPKPTLTSGTLLYEHREGRDTE